MTIADHPISTATGSMIVNRRLLDRALSIVAPAISPRGPKPVLACVELLAANDLLAIRATNLALSIGTIVAQVQIESPFVVCVQHATLADVVRSMPDDNANIRFDGTRLHIAGGASSFKIETLSAADMPPAPSITKKTLEMPCADLSRMLEQVQMCVDSAGSMSGILIESNGKRLSLVATNGKRLSISELNGAFGKASLIVTSEPFCVLSEDKDAEAELCLDDSQFGIRCGDSWATSNVVEGSFPDFRDIIPEAASITATVGRIELLTAIGQIRLIGTVRNKYFSICSTIWTLNRMGIHIGTRAETNEGEASIACKVIGEIKIGLNLLLIEDWLKTVETDEVKIGMDSPSRPVLFTANPNERLVVMPINIQ